MLRQYISARAPTIFTIISRVESWCSSSKRSRAASVAASSDGRAPTPRLDAVELLRTPDAGVDVATTSMTATIAEPHGEPTRAWPQHRHHGEGDQQHAAGSVRDVVEPLDHDAEQFAGERAAGGRARWPAAPGRSAGRHDRAQHDHPAQPDDQREDVDVPQREHQVIIMTILGGSLLPVQTSSRVAALKNIATRLRIDSVRSTSEAGSGHPSTCCSAADIIAALFFAEMRYDPRTRSNVDNDRFVLSKGHAAPMLYAAWAEAGIIPPKSC